MTNDEKAGWRIYYDDLLIGTAFYRSSDQPWFVCDFEPTPEFEKYRATFDEYAELVNNPQSAKATMHPADYYEMNIESLNLRLAPFGDVWQGEIFIAQIYDGHEAWLRPL